MTGPRWLACRRHRPALVAFVDRREEGPGTPAALAHLDRCGSCRAELEAIARTVIALHRLAGDLDRIAPSAASAPRVVRPSRRSMRLPRLSLAGPLLATALAAVVVLPTLGLQRQVVPQTDARPAAEPAVHARQLSAEYLPDKGSGSAQFWTYGTYGLTAQVLWPPSGPSRLSLDPERARFAQRSAGRVPGAWSSGAEQVATVVAGSGGASAAGPPNAESI